MVFTLFILFLILLRIGELILSKRNEKWLLQNGAIEYGQKHYPLIVALHVFFIVSLIVEYSMKRTVSYNFFLLVLYFLLLVFKAWIILLLGKFWNTKIYRIPNYPLIKKGLYRYFKHPNYMIVIIEIAVIPLIFHLYFTAIIFSVFNAIVLTVRIKAENRVLNV
ncbi:isoprenylcysteine carboxyl methyltransferase family protein [uncultured Bacteroides sp.]|uniref:isoprenylcysteine carboxyl methyltransferase family protein n=1 Tax=uncultured Bacteroides sp. TaxID=162156 RepID=UPI0037498554